MDLLNHEVLIAALLRSFRIPGNLYRFMGNFIPVQVIESDRSGSQPGHFEISDIADLAGVFQYSRDIGSQITFAVRNTDDHWAVFPCSKNLSRIIPEHQSQCIGTAYSDHGSRDGVDRPDFVLLIIIVHQLDDDFCVGLGIEGVAVAQELCFQLGEILDDPVVDSDHLCLHFPRAGAGAVAADMRVGVGLAGFSVCRPAGMADTAGSRKCRAVVRFDSEIAQFSGSFHNFSQFGAVSYRKSCGIVASVFQSGQTVQQDRRSLVFSGKSNNTAHSVFLQINGQ